MCRMNSSGKNKKRKSGVIYNIYNLFLKSMVSIDTIEYTKNKEKNRTGKSNQKCMSKICINKTIYIYKYLPVLTEILDANIRPPITATAVQIPCPMTTPAVT